MSTLGHLCSCEHKDCKQTWQKHEKQTLKIVYSLCFFSCIVLIGKINDVDDDDVCFRTVCSLIQDSLGQR